MDGLINELLRFSELRAHHAETASKNIGKLHQCFNRDGELSKWEIAKLLLQDSSEAIFAHHEKGFSTDPLIQYVEFWGSGLSRSVRLVKM